MSFKDKIFNEVIYMYVCMYLSCQERVGISPLCQKPYIICLFSPSEETTTLVKLCKED
jgi:hypothetical protein